VRSCLLKTWPCNYEKKYKLITEIYGFAADSWEARTTPSAEAFLSFKNPLDAKQFFDNESKI
jgi:hypothetical protein